MGRQTTVAANGPGDYNPPRVFSLVMTPVAKTLRAIGSGTRIRANRLVTKWRKRKGLRFCPPKYSPAVVATVRRCLPWILSTFAEIKSVEVRGMENLKEISGERAVITPNHPTRMDPLLAFELSKQLGEPFNYIASRESFTLPFLGGLIQRCGAYSVLRGTADRESFRMTRRLLKEGARKIVIFPEGLTYSQNDVLMPFHEGVVQFGFWALEDLAKKGSSPPLYYVPVGLKYLYTKPMGWQISKALLRLELHLGIMPDPKRNKVDRLREVGEKVLAGVEAAYGVKPDEDAGFNDRIQAMKEVWVVRTEQALGMEERTELPLGDRIRVLINALDRIVFEEPTGSAFEKKTLKKRQDDLLPLYRDLDRSLRFLATGGSYVAESPSDERFLEIIGTLEEDIFGNAPARGPRKAVMQIGKPIDISRRLEQYREDHRGTVSLVTKELEASVFGLVSGLQG